MPLFGNSGKFFGRKAPPENTTIPAPAALPVEELLARWQTESIGDHPLQIFEPAGEASPEGCVLFLHGHGRQFLNENATFTQLLQQHNLVAVCPDGRRSWWMNRICHEFSPDVTPQDWLLETVTPWIEQRFGITPPHVAPMGVSMGGQGALQLSFRDATRYPVVAAIAPAIDFHQLHGHGLPLDDMYESVEDARQETVILNLHPLAWPRHQWFCCDPDDTEWFDGAVRLGMKLSSSGILHERDLDTRGGGHTWDYFNRMAAAAFAHIVRGLAAYEKTSTDSADN